MKAHLANFKADMKSITSNLEKSIDLSKGIINSAKILHMYNKNIISMQQLKNKKLKVNSYQTTQDPLIFTS